MTDQLDTAQLQRPYVPLAAYFEDADCVEYVAEDTFCTYVRIDEYLTLVYDETCFRVIGFKLKGFRYIFNQMAGQLKLNQDSFLRVVSIIERVVTELGEAFVSDDRRARAYQAAIKIADQNNVQLFDLPIAA